MFLISFVAWGFGSGEHNQSGDQAAGMIASVQYHRRRTSGKHYNLRPAKSIALRSKEIINVIFDGEVTFPTEDQFAAYRQEESALLESWKTKFCRTRARASGGAIPKWRTNPTKAIYTKKDKCLFFHKGFKWSSTETFQEEAWEPVPIPDGEGTVRADRQPAPVPRIGEAAETHVVFFAIQSGADPQSCLAYIFC